MLLSNARLKSEMAGGRKVKGSPEPETLSPSSHNHRQRSASLFLTPDQPNKGERKLSRGSPGPSIQGQGQDERRLSRTESQPAAVRDQLRARRATAAQESLPDVSKRRNTTVPQEKKTIRQMFNRLTTKNEAAASQGQQVEVHPYTEDPTIAWEILKANQPVKIVKPMNLDSPMYEDRVRFVCISDTHAKSLDKVFIPNGDILLVAGDFTSCGHPKEIIAFNDFLGTLPHKHKVVISGNHELPFDSNWSPTHSVFPGLEKLFKSADNKGQLSRSVLQEALYQENVTNPRQLLTNCIFLEDSTVTLFGLRIYGTPWVPKFDGWAYNLPRGQHMLDKWNRIPVGVDVLLTHTPPLGHGDLTRSGVRAGCVELLNSVRRRIRPKYHVFGHIHEGYGCSTDGYTKFINACTCDIHMKPSNDPVLFDIALPRDESKF